MKVLVVDDHGYNRELMGLILSDHGFDYVCARDGSQACSLFDTEDDIDIVLMDVNMPVMDGYQATKIMKADSQDRFVPIIFVTAMDNDKTLQKCLDVGGDDFVPKPVNEAVLVSKLRAHQRTVNLHRSLSVTNERLEYHQRVMEREHSIVEHVFQNGIRRIDTACENVNFHVSPMTMFNGDLLLSAPSPSGGVYVLLGDFTGHGLSAAIGCLPVSDIFYAMSDKQAGVGDIASEINDRLVRLLPDNMFFCATLIEMNQGGDRLSIWSGGMNDLLLLDRSGAIVDRIAARNMPLGVLGTEEFEREAVFYQPPPDTRLFAYTDGVIETRNPQGEMFGEDRLAQLLSAPLEQGLTSLFEAVSAFREQGEQDDDISMVEIICRPVSHCNHSRESRYSDVEPIRTDAAGILPWSIDVELAPHHLRQPDTVKRLVSMIADVEGAAPHKDILYTLLSEMYSNALEHGLLQLESVQKETTDGFSAYYQARTERLEGLQNGKLSFNLQVIPGPVNRLQISVTDTGPGFDVAKVQQCDDDTDDLPTGRGIDLLRSLSEAVEFSNGGRTLTLTYLLD
ncbi:fused response regulator/phosphatase [Exilibacterium tricleocarpae]|uniref:Fused response regulator/phosphatase n=1 Tax=Exilibacterium tricleocarpae TaxID=2591008 RepID=A0A545U3R8_9GAMM|nr:fused response regulator/phosphatase [Exilibacterium tricleocarpae]TQV84110.1 fused response regulator/phosphatase [Exilibacterium tricleocarpae]